MLRYRENAKLFLPTTKINICGAHTESSERKFFKIEEILAGTNNKTDIC